MFFNEFAKNFADAEIINPQNVEIKGISYNSKQTRPGDIFVCLKGENTDGHKYAESALEKGAVALLCEDELPLNIPQIKVKSTQFEIAKAAAAIYDNPSEKLNMIGVTGTNGKTTVTHLIQKIFEANSQKCALTGTLGCKFSSGDDYIDLHHTTPQAPDFQNMLSQIVSRNIKNVVSEVSSHSIEQNRIGSCTFNAAVLTNLTQDHLDFHITMNRYFEAKAKLFRRLLPGSVAVINADDEYAQRFVQAVPEGVKIITYSVKNPSDYKAENVIFSTKGASFDLNGRRINLKLNGMFSVYNTLAAIALTSFYDIPFETAISTLEKTEGVAGRFEVIISEPLVIVDYAHTPDGLKNVLNAALEIKPENGRLICLFGCGGDRDATKRPKMGKIADELSDITIVTSDNPRSENPDLIISDIMAGFSGINPEKVYVEPDRGKAIALLKKIANKDDVVIVAGKGHENYQILKDKTIHFDDREEVRKVFEGVCL